MKLSMPLTSMPWLLLSVFALGRSPVAAAKIRQTVSVACDCASDDGQNSLKADMAAFGITGLLQDGVDAGEGARKRPRDCTCITGHKTYQTTPRDELVAMGVLTLGRHLAKCERDLEGLEGQRDYAVAEREVKVKKAKEQTSEATKLLANTKNASALGRTQSRAQKQQLMKEISDMEKNVTDLNTKYNAEFRVWWALKYEMNDKLAKTTNCKCKEGKSASFLQRVQGDPNQAYKYDTAQKVYVCETKVIKVSKEIAQAQAIGRKATITAVEDRDAFGRSMADQQHLSKVLDQKSQLKMLDKTKVHMKDLVKSRQDKVDKYKATNEEIRKQLKSLQSHLEKCNCY